MAKGRRGEVWRANLSGPSGHEQAGTRPVLVLQNLDLDPLSTVVVVAITENVAQAAFATGVQIPATEAGLPRESVVLCHHIFVLDRERLAQRYGELAPERLAEVERVVALGVGLPAL
jgi:mRNA interferase MazF